MKIENTIEIHRYILFLRYEHTYGLGRIVESSESSLDIYKWLDTHHTIDSVASILDTKLSEIVTIDFTRPIDTNYLPSMYTTGQHVWAAIDGLPCGTIVSIDGDMLSIDVGDNIITVDRSKCFSSAFHSDSEIIKYDNM